MHQHLAVLGAAVEFDVPELCTLVNFAIPLTVGVVHIQLAGVETEVHKIGGISGRAAAVLVGVHVVTALVRNHRKTTSVRV